MNMTKGVTSEVLVFKTNIFLACDLEKVSFVMDSDPRITRWNIDRHDIDNVLRIEADQLTPTEIIILINAAGFYCEELPD
jgi:hypothetical protein